MSSRIRLETNLWILYFLAFLLVPVTAAAQPSDSTREDALRVFLDTVQSLL